MLGVTIRNPFVNFLLFGWRAALIVYQAISIAMQDGTLMPFDKKHVVLFPRPARDRIGVVSSPCRDEAATGSQ